jgi:hypothetical protein
MKSKAPHKSGYVLFISLILILTISIYASIVLKTEQSRLNEANRRLHRLQAAILSYSGLNCAQAYTSGYDGRDVAWETEEHRFVCKNGGTIILSACHETGWLKVISKGCFIRDTTVYEGLLGQVPPGSAENAISIIHSTEEIAVADLAVVKGNVATCGGKVVTTSNGKFNGKTVRFKPVEFMDKIAEKSLSVFNHFPDSSKNADSVILVSSEDLNSMLINNAEKPILIEGHAALNNLTIFDTRATLYIHGELVIGELSRITGMKSIIKGNVEIAGDADIERCKIVASGNVKIEGNARFSGTVVCAETLLVGGNAKIAYPSLLYLCASGCGIDCPRVIIIKENAIVQGIVATGNFGDNLPVPRIITEFHSITEGLVFCPDALMPYGTFRGSIYTGRILYKTDNNVYVNRLKQVSIIQNDLSMITIPILLKEGIPRYANIQNLSGETL